MMTTGLQETTAFMDKTGGVMPKDVTVDISDWLEKIRNYGIRVCCQFLDRL